MLSRNAFQCQRPGAISPTRRAYRLENGCLAVRPRGERSRASAFSEYSAADLAERRLPHGRDSLRRSGCPVDVQSVESVVGTEADRLHLNVAKRPDGGDGSHFGFVRDEGDSAASVVLKGR
jgi:hypothetical protein